MLLIFHVWYYIRVLNLCLEIFPITGVVYWRDSTYSEKELLLSVEETWPNLAKACAALIHFCHRSFATIFFKRSFRRRLDCLLNELQGLSNSFSTFSLFSFDAKASSLTTFALTYIVISTRNIFVVLFITWLRRKRCTK